MLLVRSISNVAHDFLTHLKAFFSVAARMAEVLCIKRGRGLGLAHIVIELVPHCLQLLLEVTCLRIRLSRARRELLDLYGVRPMNLISPRRSIKLGKISQNYGRA